MVQGVERRRSRLPAWATPGRAKMRWAVAGFVILLGCVGTTPGQPKAAPATSLSEPTPTAEVVIELFQFRPGRLTVPVGAQVEWTNRDDVVHTVTSGVPERRTSLFHGELPGKGATFRFSAARAGTIPYFCARHDHMRGELVVQP